MKKVVAILGSVILFASFATPVLAVTQSPKVVVSQNTTTATAPSEVVSPTPTPAEEYALPYPGVLPDNPLYFLKTLRDRIMEWLVTDPIRKIDFYVLQSDKDLNAGIMLKDANKMSYIPTVLNQSLAEMGKAITLASSSQNAGKEALTGAVDHISKSIAKHEEVLTGLAAQASDIEKGTYETLLAKVKSLEEEVAPLK